jgi:hypothetical protein
LPLFPGHWAPNDIIFYTGDQFPEKYKHGAFIAFHGSWNRAPLKQKGYNVVFVPLKDGQLEGEYEVFADGFMGAPEIESPDDAKNTSMRIGTGCGWIIVYLRFCNRTHLENFLQKPVVPPKTNQMKTEKQ